MNTVKIVLTCPRCGNSTWFYRGGEFECAACGEICETEDMSSRLDKTERDLVSDCDGNCFSCKRDCENRRGTYCGG